MIFSLILSTDAHNMYLFDHDPGHRHTRMFVRLNVVKVVDKQKWGCKYDINNIYRIGPAASSSATSALEKYFPTASRNTSLL